MKSLKVLAIAMVALFSYTAVSAAPTHHHHHMKRHHHRMHHR
jgi:hypothetical protein